jgi:uncharacterized membrane protein YdjX (TVP38/TMEM64 family)
MLDYEPVRPKPTLFQRLHQAVGRMEFVRTLRRLGRAAPIAVAVTVLPPLGLAAAVWIFAQTNVELWLRDNPTVGLPLYTVAFWVIGICLIPTNAYSILGGYCFGFGWGLLGAMIGYFGAAGISFALMRKISGDRVLAVVREYPKLERVRRVLLEASPLRSATIIALLRLSPSSPFAISNFALASSGARWLPFCVGTVVGMLPRTSAVVYFASKFTKLDFRNANEGTIFIIGLIATFAVIALISWYARRELNRMTEEDLARESAEKSAEKPAQVLS